MPLVLCQYRMHKHLICYLRVLCVSAASAFHRIFYYLRDAECAVRTESSIEIKFQPHGAHGAPYYNRVLLMSADMPLQPDQYISQRCPRQHDRNKNTQRIRYHVTNLTETVRIESLQKLQQHTQT